MTKQLTLGLCLLLSCAVLTAAPEPKQASPMAIKIAKTTLGAGATVGFGYALMRLYSDTQTQFKRYGNAPNYRRASDLLTAAALIYLTYTSGLYTLESANELLADELDQDEEDQS